ncbi:MAG: hypothetical protein EHM79_00340 [Geobacter sp.]|nr:MAG: hypothetical protein EHM79_00340 [Geobacter sp.]
MTKLRSLEKLMDERKVYLDKALDLQAKEYERRLRDLNHEASRLDSMQHTYLLQSTYNTKMEGVDESISALKIAHANLQGRLLIAGSFVLAAISVLTAFITSILFK